MSLPRIRKPVFVILSLLLVLTVLSFAPQSAVPASGGNAIPLRAPSFVKVASAQERPDASPMGFPQGEAGISAYFKSASSINLADVRSVFRVIEAETADYIIGSVPVVNYPESYDVHLYVHRDGWFVAYYLAPDPVSKIADVRHYAGLAIDTLLEQTLKLAAIAAGVPFSTATFYDFRYPSATHFTLIGEAYNGGDNSFIVQLPSSFVAFERSWALYGGDAGNAYVLDGVTIWEPSWCGGCTGYGFLTAAQFLPDTPHTVAVNDSGILALIYRVP